MADLTSQDLAQLRATGQTVEVAFQIGKGGLTEGVVKELQARLAKEPLVKVKILAAARGEGGARSSGEGADAPGASSAKSLAMELAQRARVKLVEVRGFTALFYRPPRHKRAPGDY